MTPSYRSGFYSPRRGGTPKYPSLWDGCVGAWAPSLGATGLTLRGESVYGNHGTLMNMDPASDWVVSGGKGALDFDGHPWLDTWELRNRIEVNVSLSMISDFSVSCWVRLASNLQSGAFFKLGGSSGDGVAVGVGDYLDTNANNLVSLRESLAWHTTVFDLGTLWFHCVYRYTHATTSHEVFIDATSRQTFSGGIQGASVSTLAIGGYTSAGSEQRYANHHSDDIRIYNRALTPSEIRALATRRGIAYESRRRLAVRGVAGSVTGSVSSTLAAVTCSSSATLAAGLSGTVTRTLADVVSSATGTVTNGASGSVTRTLADATLASTGSFSPGLTAQVNRALDSCVVSSTGTVANGAAGSLSVQLASATLQSGNVALGGFRLKVAGEWKDAMAFVKVTGTWKSATPFVKVGGVWK